MKYSHWISSSSSQMFLSCFSLPSCHSQMMQHKFFMYNRKRENFISSQINIQALMLKKKIEVQFVYLLEWIIKHVPMGKEVKRLIDNLYEGSCPQGCVRCGNDERKRCTKKRYRPYFFRRNQGNWPEPWHWTCLFNIQHFFCYEPVRF